MEYRPCPICRGENADHCEACRGIGRFPYPWILPGDEPIRKLWTQEETEVIYDAISGNEAYLRYCFVYGETERTESSVYRHWQYIHKHETKRPVWTEPEIEIIEEAGNPNEAVILYQAEYGTARTGRAIQAKFSRLRK